jgi:Anthranilate synthase component I, N terminal region
MQIEPQAVAFAKRYARGEAQVVWTTLVSDLETPVSAFLKIAGGGPPNFLLESVEGGALRGRYSIIGLNPEPRSIVASSKTRTILRPAAGLRSRRCVRSSPKAGSSCRTCFLPWLPGFSAISAMTWCG